MSRELTSTVVDAPAVPKLTILVAAWNEADNIGLFVRSYLDLAYPNRELVLCAGGEDGTYERAAEHAGDSIVVLRQEAGEGKQGALRKAFSRATGDVVVFTDADCLLNQEGLTRLVDPILRGDERVTSGVSRPKASQMSHPFVLYQRALQFRGERVLRDRKVLGGMLGRNSAITRSVLEEVGAFEEDVPIGTDSFLAKKVMGRGYGICFVGDSAVETDYPTSVTDYWRQRSRWTRNGITHNLRFRLARGMVRALLPPAAGLTMLGLPLAGLLFHRLALWLWLPLAVHSLLLRVDCVRELRRSHTDVSWKVYALIPAYMLAEWVAHVLGLVHMLSARLRSRW